MSVFNMPHVSEYTYYLIVRLIQVDYTTLYPSVQLCEEAIYI